MEVPIGHCWASNGTFCRQLKASQKEVCHLLFKFDKNLYLCLCSHFIVLLSFRYYSVSRLSNVRPGSINELNWLCSLLASAIM